ncbi:MAG: CocE/NonD family hydrolase [Acidobacteria bacterium]|nr:CocE/NonD family hydrolase [Acidobacteriota bacterium]
MRKNGSKAEYTMKAERDVMVPMRDGVRLAADIFSPEAEGKFPALLAMSPYGKGVQSLPLASQPPGTPNYMPPIEAGNPHYFASRGYVHVIADVRGTGKSEGQYFGWQSRQESQDGYDFIEWIARQPWCDGNVGMVGISYYGEIQLNVAAEQPPHLKAIMPWNAPADFYRECTHHGGIRQMFFHYLYVQRIGADTSISATVKDTPAGELKRLIEEIKADPDLMIHPEIWNFVDCPGKAPCFFDILVHPTDGPYYWERSPYKKFDRIKIPFYTRSGWWAYGHMHLIGSFTNYLGIDAPRKLMIDRPIAEERPLPDDYCEEVLRWYDYWLKGIDTGVMSEPPIRLFIMGIDQWRPENEWPLARTEWTRFYLRRWGRLSTEPEPFPGKPDTFVQQPPDETAEIASVQYQSDVLKSDMEVTGPMALYLHASIDQEDTNWIVSLRDVAPDGLEKEMTKGFLKASHRAVDRGKSKPWQPYHPHLKPEPVVPGTIYEYAIEISPTAYVFKAGHRLKLLILSMDHPKARDWKLAPATLGASHMPWHICSSRTTLHRIYHDLEHPSALLLPVIPPTGQPRE